MIEKNLDQVLLQTPLYGLHKELSAKLVPFAHYEMPLQYGKGILKEHMHTREQASLFDVSHMGQIKVYGKNAALFLENLMPIDAIGLAKNRQRYSFLTTPAGGIIDDVMLANNGDHYYLIVNAACKETDFHYLKNHLIDNCQIQILHDRALVALQGPAAVTVLNRYAPEISSMSFMSTASISIDNIDCYISRSGYTGEDGFEISVHNDDVEALARLLLTNDEVELAGLGARDSLRLEAGLCLYGHDIDIHTTPVEAKLIWAISPARRVNGMRAGGYPGAETIASLINNGTNKKRVGLISKDRIPVREGTEIFNQQNEAIGQITSGSYSPVLGVPIAMGYVKASYSNIGSQLIVKIRGKNVTVEVCPLPFIPHRYFS